MKIQTPLSNYLIVRPLTQSKTSKGGIVLADKVLKNRPYWYGEVTNAGPGFMNDRGAVMPMTVKVGDVVCVPKNAGEALPDPDGDLTDELRIVRENFVIFIVDPDSIPRESMIKGLDGKPLQLSAQDAATVRAIEDGTFEPQSRALPDSVYANREAHAKAIEGGWIRKDDPDYVDEFEPGDAPDPEDDIKRARNATPTIITNK